MLSLALVFAAPVSAQTAGSGPAVPAPLARYVPRDQLLVFADFAGLDANADAWQKTAAFKMLNETSLGAMLEDLGAQLFDKSLLKRLPNNKLTGAEAVTLVKHLAHAGFVLGMAGDAKAPRPECVVFVLRAPEKKADLGLVTNLLLSFGKPDGKPRVVKMGERSVVAMPSPTQDHGWTWWREKNDVVVALAGPKSADVAIEVIDGKRPNAVDHPIRAELVKAEDGFTPVGVAYVDLARLTAHPKTAEQFAKAQLDKVSRVDLRWGLQNEALMSVVRFQVPSPRQGMLALFDEPKFDKKALPPMPEGIEGFTAFSVDLDKAVDTLWVLLKASNPEAAQKIEEGMKSSKGKSKIDLRKDVLAHVGPKLAYYVAQGKTAEKPAEPGAPGGFDPVAMMLSQIQVPKFVLVAEVDNPEKFAKTLDDLVFMLNRGLREAMAGAGGPGAMGGPPGAPGGGPTAGGAPKSKGAPSVPAPEFKLLPGKAKAYALNVPSELGKLPAGIKPTIRLGGKHIVVAINPAAATQAVEFKGGWKPEGDFAATFEKVPADLIVLNLNDPRNTMPAALVSLPRELQKAINSALAQANPMGAGGPPGGSPGAPGGANPAPPGAFPGAPGAPNAAAAEMVQFQVDPAKMPAADALKSRLFPGSFAVTVNDQEIRLVTREAFPDLAPSNSPLSSMLQNAIKAARAKAAGGTGPPPGAPTPGGGAASPGAAPVPARPGSEPAKRDR